MKTAIMTDSNSGITQEHAKELGVYVVPMPFTIGGEEYFENGICIIEWSDIIKDAIPKDAIDVRIENY